MLRKSLFLLIFIMINIFLSLVWAKSNTDLVFKIRCVNRFTPCFKKSLKLHSSDIQCIRQKGEGIIFRLTPTAGMKLQQITAANIGQMLQIFYQQKSMSRATIQAALSTQFELTSTTELFFPQLRRDWNVKQCPVSGN